MFKVFSRLKIFLSGYPSYYQWCKMPTNKKKEYLRNHLSSKYKTLDPIINLAIRNNLIPVKDRDYFVKYLNKLLFENTGDKFLTENLNFLKFLLEEKSIPYKRVDENTGKPLDNETYTWEDITIYNKEHPDDNSQFVPLRR